VTARPVLPTQGAFAVAGLVGIVLGALGGGFARVTMLFLITLIAVGVWRAVTLLRDLVDRMASVDYPDTATTVPLNRSGGVRR
jgi:hypothetical protein